jgi:hypothetical protein
MLIPSRVLDVCFGDVVEALGIKFLHLLFREGPICNVFVSLCGDPTVHNQRETWHGYFARKHTRCRRNNSDFRRR